jgi:fatty-acyl-CoA synthase
VAVFGIPDPQWGELVAACVVLKPGMNISAEAVVGHCRERLARRMPLDFTTGCYALP